MTARTLKRILVGLAAVLALAAAAVAAWGIASPVRVASPATAGPGRADERSGAAPGLATLRPARDRLVTLAQKASPPEPEPEQNQERTDEGGEPADAEKAPVSIPVSLVGIVREPGHSMALFETKNGSIAVCGVGERLEPAAGGVALVRIAGRKAVVRFRGRTTALELPDRDD